MKEVIKNTFAPPHVKNKYFNKHQLLMALQYGAIKYEELPQKAKDMVNSIKPRMD